MANVKAKTIAGEIEGRLKEYLRERTALVKEITGEADGTPDQRIKFRQAAVGVAEAVAAEAAEASVVTPLDAIGAAP